MPARLNTPHYSLLLSSCEEGLTNPSSQGSFLVHTTDQLLVLSYFAAIPPSNGIMVPVMKSDALDARNTARPLT